MAFTVHFTTRWADFDPNRHMRHSAYNDYAAEVRLRYFKKLHITMEDFAKSNIGPILFEEHTSFRKEISLGENITANIQLMGLSKNGERWKIKHEIFKESGDLAAVIHVYGSWLDLTLRKLTLPPPKFHFLFAQLEKTVDFKEILVKSS